MSTKKLNQIAKLVLELLESEQSQQPLNKKRTVLDIAQSMVAMSFEYADRILIKVSIGNFELLPTVYVRVFPADTLEREGCETYFHDHWVESFESLEKLEHIEALLMNFLYDFDAKARQAELFAELDMDNESNGSEVRA